MIKKCWENEKEICVLKSAYYTCRGTGSESQNPNGSSKLPGFIVPGNPIPSFDIQKITRYNHDACLGVSAGKHSSIKIK